MMHFTFIACNKFELANFMDIEKFVHAFPDIQSVALKDEQELKLLLQLLGIKDVDSQTLNPSEFSSYWDLSNFRLPEFNEEQFDQFYTKWLEASERENTMDEYGHLIFLQGQSKQWNQMKYRFIVKEK